MRQMLIKGMRKVLKVIEKDLLPQNRGTRDRSFGGKNPLSLITQNKWKKRPKHLPRAYPTQMGSLSKQHRNQLHLGTSQKCRISGPTPNLQNLHFSKIPRRFVSILKLEKQYKDVLVAVKINMSIQNMFIHWIQMTHV